MDNLKILKISSCQDYELLDSGDGEKLERYGKFVLSRPDPQALWGKCLTALEWQNADAIFAHSGSKGGWKKKPIVPEKWKIEFGGLSFFIKPTAFKHTGLFPEQAANWDWVMEKIKAAKRSVSVLNLFAYTGAATVACAAEGAAVCHVDASKGIVSLAHENLELSGLSDRPVRWIIDDVLKFVKREIKRGRKYDGIIMDPPSFGRGPGGEVWKFENQIFGLIERCVQVLSENPLFFLINSYTTGFPPVVLENMLKMSVVKKFGGKAFADHLGLQSNSGLVLPCGIMGRWEK